MLLTCNNKNCNKLNDAKINPQTKEVICGECNKPISNITEFTKNVLITNKEFTQSHDEKQKFSIECTKCGKKLTPKCVDKKFVCAKCGEALKISQVFENVLRDYIK